MGIILLGAPGSGKGTQAELIAGKFNFCHISMGDLLRMEVKGKTKIGNIVSEYLKSGKLVPDEIVISILKQNINKKDCGNKFLLDGYPRTVKQALLLEKLLGDLGFGIEKVLYISVMLETAVSRLSGRRNCSSCGKIYHIGYMPSKKEGICDVCGGATVQRNDDMPETIAQRFNVYKESTLPLVDYYKKKGLLLEIDGSGNKNDIFENILKLLKFN